METEERDATSRASFKCTSCLKTFTDLEVSLFQEFLSNICYLDCLW
jgi:transposase-like protein